VAGFKSEWWPLSNRNHGRLQIGTVAGFKSEKVAAFDWNLQLAQMQWSPVAHPAGAAARCDRLRAAVSQARRSQ
jgi:hypothetical protein